ncbi:hypothetical protein HPB50_017853 [Hyalomma asiaticum]|uniref:Uncharacterized protein n=1 Tax=Hyalomma asiaticum TaxID=266040 RepID=A0ACB7SRQ5_HYAAI|nr:hypothetical protein HPB50_017853 [Hyalomma asiaticum]
MMTAFLNQRQGFVVVKKDRYSSVHYEYLDGEVQDNSTSRMKHEAITGSASAASNDDQDESVSDGETYHECVAITSSRPYIQFTIGGEHQEREEHSLKDIDIQETSFPRSQLVRKGEPRSYAKSQREGYRVSGIAEAKSTEQTYDSEVVQLWTSCSCRSRKH